MDEFFGDWSTPHHDLRALAVRLALDAAVTAIVVYGVYARIYGRGRRDYVFTYTLFNVITFALCALLDRVPVELGFALGLFAVFGILRYRTESIRMRDLTYLFVVIGVAIVNAVGVGHVQTIELAVVDGIVAAAVVILENPFARARIDEREVTYDKLDLLRPENGAALLRDLAERTGLDVRRVVIERVDLVREVATIVVHYARARPTSAGPPRASGG